MRTKARRSRTIAVGLATVLSAGLLAGCSTGDAAAPDNRILVWTQENLPPRMAATEKILDRFTEETGVEVELVGVDENQLPQLIMSAAAAGRLPDVLAAAPMGQVWQMYSNDLLNTEVSTEIVERLGRKTFDATALDFTSDGDKRLGVPSDAWLALLAFRKDLLEKEGLPAPDTYEGVLKAARALDKDGRSGISLATDPADILTQQTFEGFAVGNDCRLVDDQGAVRLDSPACRTSFDTYDKLARGFGPPGSQNVDSTRATYFSGQSAMLGWSSFLLDELAGLRKDALPSCPECKKDPGFLARNTGLVTAMKGPDGKEPTQLGEVTSWAVTRTAETGASRTFVEYMMSKGYEDWFGMAPEGKIPVRTGTPDDTSKYQRAWRASSLGVDERRPMDEVYPRELLDQLIAGVSDMQRWGIAQGEGALVGATNGELPVPKAIGAMTGGQISPAEAAREAQDEVAALQESLR
ncbi:ABC transporter substrate-binding protein [Streptomyces sp. NPDC096176]|uniref:ABC transporter substrate-binding protein n=1 Tax=Streptomyces sp. NPDC096176 TaxID=3366079 RepID=UPI0037F92DFA